MLLDFFEIISKLIGANLLFKLDENLLLVLASIFNYSPTSLGSKVSNMFYILIYKLTAIRRLI